MIQLPSRVSSRSGSSGPRWRSRPAPGSPPGSLRVAGVGLLLALLLSGPARAQDRPKADADPAASPAPARDGRFAPEKMRQVKAATALILVGAGDALSSQGSGFFCAERGIVCTNAHVLNMLRPGSPPPRAIRVYCNSGEPDERGFDAEVLGVDRQHDLAVLRVDGRDLPDPLEVASAAGLHEFDDLYVYGFPRAAQIGVAVSGNKTSLTRLDRDGRRGIVRLVVAGGLAPGNSGGPIVDASGRVVGVSTDRLIDEAQIGRAVAGDVVLAMLNGRVVEMSLGQPFVEGDRGARAPVILRLLDPLNKVRDLAVACWPGPMLDPKEAREHPPGEPALDDPRRRSVALNVVRVAPGAAPAQDDLDPRHLSAEPGEFRATGDIPLPPIEGGETYWMQPSYVDGSGIKRRWVESRWDDKAPVERKPASLVLKLRKGQSSLVDLRTRFQYEIRGPKVNSGPVAIGRSARLEEAVGPIAPSGFAEVTYRFATFAEGGTARGKPLNFGAPREEAARQVPGQVARLQLDRRNLQPADVRLFDLDAREDLAEKSREAVRAVVLPTLFWLRALAIPLPGGSKGYDGHPWAEPSRELQPISVDGPGDDDFGRLQLRYKYLGRRKADDREQALIELGGRLLAERGGPPPKPIGKVEGLATLDLASGQIVEVNLGAVIHDERTLEGAPHQLSGDFQIQLRRTPSEPGTP